jgi:hypothetical protein
MATTIDELQVLITANAASFSKQLQAVQRQMGAMSAGVKSSGVGVAGNLKSMAGKFLALGAVVAGVSKSITAAMSYIEDENLFQVSMKSAADSTRAWSDQVQNSVGVSSAWLRKYTGIMTNMTASMGVAQGDAAELGKNVALLSNDIASFYNIDPASAFEKMQSAMAGMPRPLQELGIMVREQELEQTALAMGIKKTNNEWTAAQKALLTYQTVINQTKNAQGDLARTINSPANQLRMLKTSAVDLSVAFGTMFQPLLSVALPAINAIIIAATRGLQALAGLFGIQFDPNAYAGGMEDIAGGVGDVGDAAGEAADKAKKLQKQLASFDEMNVLKEPESGSSGSSGSGGAVSMPSIDWGQYNSGLEGITNKAIEMADRIGEAFKDFAKGFDFGKISKALKKFWDDCQKFFKPVGKILADVWEYLKPFIYWVGNDFLPGFLNAVGGAIAFVGAVIGTAWDKFLKPFVDAFLVPIAQWTGGVVVTVLNAIGDALRWIAGNQGAVDFLLTTLITIGSVLAGLSFAKFLIEFGEAISMFKMAKDAGQTTSIALGSVADATSGATSKIAAMGSGLTGLVGKLKSMAGAIGAVVAVSVDIWIAKQISQMSAYRDAADLAKEKTDGLKQIQDGLAQSISNTAAKQSELNTLLTNEQSLAQAEADAKALLKDRQDAYNLAIQNYGKNSQEARDALIEVDAAQLNADQTAADYANRIKDIEAKTKELKDAQKQQQIEQAATNLFQADGTLTVHKYEKALEEAGDTGIYSSEELRKQVESDLDKQGLYWDDHTHTVETKGDKMWRELGYAVTDWATKVGTAVLDAWNAVVGWFGKVGEWFGTKFTEAKDAIAKAFGAIGAWFGERWNDIKNVFSNAWNAFADIGKNIWEGLKNGIGNLADKIKGMFTGAIDSVKKFLGIASPSKLFKEIGGFVDSGFTIGIEGGASDVIGAAYEMARGVAETMADISIPPVSADLAYRVGDRSLDMAEPSIGGGAGWMDELAERIGGGRPVYVNVNIDWDDIRAHLVEGMNEDAIMRDRNTLRVF